MDMSRRDDFRASINARDYVQNNRTDNNDNNRSIKGTAYSPKGRFSGKVKALIAAGILIVTTGTVLSINEMNYQKEHKEILSTNLQHTIITEALEDAKANLTVDDLIFNGTNFETSIKTNSPNKFKVLQNTDTDELLSEYFSNPTEEEKHRLDASKIADLNFQLVKASLADSLGCDIADIKIKFSDTSLTIYASGKNLEYWADEGKHNDTQISLDYAALLRNIAETYQQSKLDPSQLDIDEQIKLHDTIKTILDEHDFTIKDNALCLKNNDNGKFYSYSNSLIGRAKFTELKEKESDELEL